MSLAPTELVRGVRSVEAGGLRCVAISHERNGEAGYYAWLLAALVGAYVLLFSTKPEAVAESWPVLVGKYAIFPSCFVLILTLRFSATVERDTWTECWVGRGQLAVVEFRGQPGAERPMGGFALPTLAIRELVVRSVEGYGVDTTGNDHRWTTDSLTAVLRNGAPVELLCGKDQKEKLVAAGERLARILEVQLKVTEIPA